MPWLCPGSALALPWPRPGLPKASLNLSKTRLAWIWPQRLRKSPSKYIFVYDSTSCCHLELSVQTRAESEAMIARERLPVCMLGEIIRRYVTQLDGRDSQKMLNRQWKVSLMIWVHGRVGRFDASMMSYHEDDRVGRSS